MSTDYLLVDGYNIIFSWPELKALAEQNMDSARTKLQDILCNYQGFKKCNLILVFDGYKVKQNPGTVITYHNIHVIFTKEAETADQYIEKVAQAIGRVYSVRVATSDKLEQVIILGKGAVRMSARELLKEIEETNTVIRKEHLEKKTAGSRNRLFDNVDPQLYEYLERIRLNRDVEEDSSPGHQGGRECRRLNGGAGTRDMRRRKK